MVENLPQTIAALLLVLSVIFAGGYVLRRISNAMPNPAGRPSDLKVVEWRGLDSRRKLAVVRWDEKEHLLCLGPGGDTIVASRRRPRDPDASTRGREQKHIASPTESRENPRHSAV